MAIDTTIQFNDHNSYKITTPLFCYPFGVDGMSYITHSFQAYSTSSLSSANRAKTKFFDADGALVSDVNHAFAVTTVFGKIEITAAVPATAKQAQLVLIQGGTDWWIAEPKSEQGEVATPYNVNYQGQLTYITPNGIYTGMMTTGQIVVTGSVASPDETLDTRLVTINNGVINLSATVNNHETRVTTIEAGQASFVKFDDLGTPGGTYINGGNIKTGKIQSVSGASYFDLTNGQIKSNNVDLTGKVVATSGNIGGLVVGSNDLKITVSKVYGPFSQADYDRVSGIILRTITPTAADYDKYDFYGSGRLTASNLTVINRMINGTYGWTNPDTITYQVAFSTSNTNNLVTLTSDKFTEKTVIRPASVETSHGKYWTLEATNIDAMSFGSNGNIGTTGSFKAKNASGNDVTVTVTGGIITSIS